MEDNAEVIFCGEKIIQPDYEAITWDDILEKKYKYSPEHLYKYCACKDYAFEAIKNGTIFLQSATNFNDPFDCLLKTDNKKIRDKFFSTLFASIGCVYNPNLKFSHNIDHLYRYLQGNISQQKAIEKINQYSKIQLTYIKSLFSEILLSCYLDRSLLIKESFEKKFEKLSETIMSDGFVDMLQYNKLCCFSSSFISQLMWSHYADNHQGFCVDYKIPIVTDKDDLGKLPDDEYILWRYLLPVAYMHNRIDVTEQICKCFEKPLSMDEQLPIWKYGYMSKSMDWQYEKEWRFLFPYSNFDSSRKHALSHRMITKKDEYGKEKQNIRFFPISAIYLGCKMIEENKKNIIEIIKEFHADADIYEGSVSETEYKIKFSPIDKINYH